VKSDQGMTVVVKTVTRVSVWVILMYGIYIVFHGHLTPGGGFQGGVILALAFLNVLLAYGRDFTGDWLNIGFLNRVESGSITLFLIIGILGLLIGGGFLANFIGHGELFRLVSAGTIPLLNIAIGAKVAMSLFLVIWVLSHLQLEEGEEI